MLMTSSLDLWQKDVFFSAAEEVQASADIMESAYRRWVRQRMEGLASIDLDDLCRELQTALGTAKWQLDEFQRAISLSYRKRADEIRTTRHQQFVSAIEAQISRVETALKEYFSAEVKKPLRWINLDEEERNDLAMFLSGVSNTKDSNSKPTSCDHSYVVQVKPVEVLGTSDGSSRRTQDVVPLNITVDHSFQQKKPLMSSDDGSVWKRRRGNYWINQVFRRAAGSQRQLQASIRLQRSHSFRLTFVLLLAIFLLVPFVMYSNYM